MWFRFFKRLGTWLNFWFNRNCWFWFFSSVTWEELLQCRRHLPNQAFPQEQNWSILIECSVFSSFVQRRKQLLWHQNHNVASHPSTLSVLLNKCRPTLLFPTRFINGRRTYVEGKAIPATKEWKNSSKIDIPFSWGAPPPCNSQSPIRRVEGRSNFTTGDFLAWISSESLVLSPSPPWCIYRRYFHRLFSNNLLILGPKFLAPISFFIYPKNEFCRF